VPFNNGADETGTDPVRDPVGDHGRPRIDERRNGYVKAYQAAELDERVARVEQLSDGELMRIAKGRQPEDVRRMSKLLMLTCDK
jgi:hypothetical protein